jgi:hypothetical protein
VVEPKTPQVRVQLSLRAEAQPNPLRAHRSS